MAPRKVDPVGGGEKHGTIEIAYVKLSGNDTTLQRVVDAFTTLINKSAGQGNALASAKRVNSLPPAYPDAAANGNGAESASLRDDEAIEVEANESEVTARPAPSAPKAPRKYTLPTAIPIDTEAGEPVSDFVRKYKLESHEERYLGLAAWLKANHPQTTLKAGHIVTLYRHLDWTLPADVTMSFRRMVSKKWQWLERKDRGDYIIHQVGESKLAKLKA